MSKSQKNFHKEVKQAVEEVEDYISEQEDIEASNENKTNIQKENKKDDNQLDIGNINGGEGKFDYHAFGAGANKKIWLWLAVGIFTTAIVLMWLFSLDTKFYDFSRENDASEQMVQQTQQDLDQLMANFNQTSFTNNTTSKPVTNTSTSSSKKDKKLKKAISSMLNSNNTSTINNTTTQNSTTNTVNTSTNN